MRKVTVTAMVEATFYTNYTTDETIDPAEEESNEQDEASLQAGNYVECLRNLAGIPDEYEGDLSVNTLSTEVIFLTKAISDDLSECLG